MNPYTNYNEHNIESLMYYSCKIRRLNPGGHPPMWEIKHIDTNCVLHSSVEVEIYRLARLLDLEARVCGWYENHVK